MWIMFINFKENIPRKTCLQEIQKLPECWLYYSGLEESSKVAFTIADIWIFSLILEAQTIQGGKELLLLLFSKKPSVKDALREAPLLAIRCFDSYKFKTQFWGRSSPWIRWASTVVLSTVYFPYHWSFDWFFQFQWPFPVALTVTRIGRCYPAFVLYISPHFLRFHCRSRHSNHSSPLESVSLPVFLETAGWKSYLKQELYALFGWLYVTWE